MQKFLTRLMSDPRFKEALHKKMRRLEKKLERLAYMYFGHEITVIYTNKLTLDKIKKSN